VDQISQKTLSLWAYLNACRQDFLFPFFKPTNRVLMPVCSLRVLKLWASFYLRFDEIYTRSRKKKTDKNKVRTSTTPFLSPPNSPNGTNSGTTTTTTITITTKLSKSEKEESHRASLSQVDPNSSHSSDSTSPNNSIGIRWVPNSWSDACADCQSKFTLSRRRHHCRACGQLFCKSCTKQKIALPSMNYHTPVRVCEQCFESHKLQMED